MKTVTIQIDNTDHRLSQELWSRFNAAVAQCIYMYSSKLCFEGSSSSAGPIQNSCWVIEASEKQYKKLVSFLEELKNNFNQDAIEVTDGHTITV